MAAMSGTNGKVTNGANTIANMMDWSVALKGTTVDVSAFGGSGWGASIGTIKTWTGTMSGNFDPTDSLGQVALNAGLAGAFTVFFYTDAVHNWTGSAILTDIAFTSSASGVIKVVYTFAGSSSLVYS